MNQSALMTASQMTCSHCSAVVEQEDRFCRDCGTRQIQRGKRFSTVLLDQRRKEEPTNPLMKAEMLLLVALGTFVVSTVVWCMQGPGGGIKAPVQAKKVQPLSEMDRLFAQAKTMPVAAVAMPTHEQAARMLIVTPLPDPTPAAAGRGEMRQAERAESRSVPSVRNKNVEDVAEYNKALAEFFQKTKTPEVVDTVDGVPTAPPPAEPPSFEEWLKGGKKSF